MYFGYARSDWKDNDFSFDSVHGAMVYFYIALLYDKKTHTRYLKVGTAKNINKRYNANYPIGRRYRFNSGHNYTHVRILATIAVETAQAYSLEKEAREILKKVKGLTWVPNDRFRYFLLPQTIKLPKNNFLFTLEKGEYGEKYAIFGRLT